MAARTAEGVAPHRVSRNAARNFAELSGDQLVRNLEDACASARAVANLPSVPKGLNLSELGDKVFDLLLGIRALQNKRHPAGRLPNEVLSVVFKMIQDDLLAVRNFGCVYENFRHYSKWTRVLRVCRHWREVGLTAPYLWSTIFATSRHLPIVQTYDATSHLQRSSQWPLKVFVDLRADPMVILKLLNQMSRIRELTVQVHYLDPLTLPLTWCTPGPELKVLALAAPYHDSSQTLQQLFSGNVSRVPSLIVSRIADFTRLDLAAVTHLHLHRCHLEWIGAHESLLTFLAGAPFMEDLKFTDLVLEDYEDVLAEEGAPIVDLLRLKRLAFVESGANVATLLSRLQLPAGVSLTFPWKQPFNAWDECQIFPANTERLQNLQDLENLELRFSDACDVVTVRAVGNSPGSSAFYARWTLGNDHDPIAFADDFPAFFQYPEKLWVYLNDVKNDELRLSRQEFLRTLLCWTGELKTLSLLGGAQVVIQDLQEMLRPAWGDVDSANDLVCSGLEEVNIPFHEGDSYSGLLAALQTREGVGCALQRIHLYRESGNLGGWSTNTGDPKNPWSLQESVREVVLREGEVPEMEWVDACSSQSDGPWEWPVWTKDGGCSYAPHGQLYYA